MSSEIPNFCPICGQRVTDKKAVFCSKCGSRLIGKSASNKGENKSNLADNSSGNAGTGVVGNTNYPNRMDFGNNPVNPQTNNPLMQNPLVYGYNNQPDDTTNQLKLTPDQIKGVKYELFNQSELKNLIIFTFIAIISHILRIMLIFNRFPSLLEIVISVPLYFLLIIGFYSIIKIRYYSSGMPITLNIDKFQYTQSLVLSTFFITYLPLTFKYHYEESNIPETVWIPDKKDYYKYKEIGGKAYVRNILEPQIQLITYFILIVSASVLLYLYLNTDPGYLANTWRLSASYLAGFVFMELTPLYGIHRQLLYKTAKYRTFFIFLFSLIILVISIFGDKFLTVLMYK